MLDFDRKIEYYKIIMYLQNYYDTKILLNLIPLFYNKNIYSFKIYDTNIDNRSITLILKQFY